MEEVVNKKTEEGKKKNRTSLKSILGGDILATDFFRRQTKLLVLIMVFIIFYIHNRYASQQQQIEIDRLKKELTDIKYDALTRSSELMEKSRTLREYMIFVETVRNYEKEYEFKEAVEYAIDDCIRNNILRSFLTKSRAEVLRVFLFEYDQEKHIRQEKDESREEGRKEGIKEGIKLGRKEGLELGEIQMLVKQMQKGRITMEEAAEDAGMTVEKFTYAMEHVMSQLI